MSRNDLIHLIVNPAAGHGQGPEFVTTHVLPIFHHFKLGYKVHTTLAPLHAGEICRAIVDEAAEAGGSKGEAMRAMVVGGDGTLHEMMEGLLGGAEDGKGCGTWEVVILPMGTANALYYSVFAPTSPLPNVDILSSLPNPPPEGVIPRLLSLVAFLSKASRPVELPITTTTLSAPGQLEKTVISTHVVLSTSLHAAILDTSEPLRAEYPGPERFKIAAQANVGKFFYADVRLYGHPPGMGGGVEQWDPRRGAWVRPFTLTGRGKREAEEWTMEGPFGYFLSTSTVDRLEPTFVISPRTSLRSTGPSSLVSWIYLTVLRPLRDPGIVCCKREERPGKWGKRVMEVLGKAYEGGTHVDLTFPEAAGGEGGAEGGAEVRGMGKVVVEYLRVASFTWTPTPMPTPTPIPTVVSNPSDDNDNQFQENTGDASLVCADGAIHRIPPGNSISVRVRGGGGGGGGGGEGGEAGEDGRLRVGLWI